MAEKKKKEKKINWEKIKTEYITQDISQRKLAAKHKVSYDTLKRKCAEESWVELRREYKRNVTAKAMDAIAGEQAMKIAERFSVVDTALERVKELYADAEQFNRHLVEREDDDGKHVEERIFQKLDTKAMKDGVVMLEKLVNLTRDIYDLPNQQTREAQRIAAERLALEQEKADRNDGVQTIEVIYSGGEPEDWSG